MIKLPAKKELLATFLIKRCCHNCKYWDRRGTIPSNALCKKHNDIVPLEGYCPLYEISKHILTIKILSKKLLER